ncbi:MAG: DUF4132 domain-containing protein [Thermoguttaceae bacterium]|nr:DUF4132 domain-containing protein [Thermoguttaceae bacterium]
MNKLNDSVQEKINTILLKRALLPQGVWRDLFDAAAWVWISDTAFSEDKSDLEEAWKAHGIDRQEVKQILRQEEVLEQLAKPGCPFWSAFPESFQAVLPRSVEILFRTPWQSGLYRRTFRTSYDKTLYADDVARLIDYCFKLLDSSLTLEKSLYLGVSGGDEDEEKDPLLQLVCVNPFIDFWIADALDRRDPFVCQYIRDAVYEGAKALTNAAILACFQTVNPDALTWISDYMLSLKLEEGIRQNIAESCDQGTFDAFCYMVHFIDKHNLIRFSSVTRAFLCWVDWTGTGTGQEAAARPETIKKQFKEFVQFLDAPVAGSQSALPREITKTAPDGRFEYYLSHVKMTKSQKNNPVSRYLALSALAAKDAVVAVQSCMEIIESDDETFPVKATAAYMLKQIKLPIEPIWILDQLDRRAPEPVLTNLLLDRIQYSAFPDDDEGVQEAREIYWRLRKLFDRFPAKSVSAFHPVFPEMELSVSQELLFEELRLCVKSIWEKEELEDLSKLAVQLKASSFSKTWFISTVLRFYAPTPDPDATDPYYNRKVYKEDLEHYKTFPRTDAIRNSIFDFLSDRTPSVKEEALKLIVQLESLTDDELTKVKSLLKAKSASVQELTNKIIKKFDSQTEDDKTVVLWTEQNGFGLYDPTLDYSLPIAPAKPEFRLNSFVPKNAANAIELIRQLDAFISEHKFDEIVYTNWQGARVTTISELEAEEAQSYIRHYNADNPKADRAAPELWDSFFEKRSFSVLEGLSALAIIGWNSASDKKRKEIAPFYGADFNPQPGKIQFPYFCFSVITRQVNKQPDFEQKLLSILEAFVQTPKELICKTVDNVYYYDQYLLINLDEFNFWFSLFERLSLSQRKFACLWRLHALLYELYQNPKLGGKINFLDVKELLQAYDQNIISSEAVFMALIKWRFAEEPGRLSEEKEAPHPLLITLFKRIADVELTRTAEPTGLSGFVSSVKVLPGVEYAVKLLEKMGDFKYTQTFGWNNNWLESVCYLLRVSRPEESDTADDLRQALKKHPIKKETQRLIELTMYAPWYAELVGEYLGRPDLATAVWFFQAHVRDEFSPEMTARIARYSDVTTQQFQNEAIDPQWLQKAMDAAGQELFPLMYEASKYIAGGSRHRQIQIYIDAVSGKLSVEQIQAQIEKSRNQNYVRALGVAPIEGSRQEAVGSSITLRVNSQLKKKDSRQEAVSSSADSSRNSQLATRYSQLIKADVLSRYQFLQTFLKQSKQFGAQKRASESAAVETAIENLARLAGCDETDRFVWRMENAQLDAVRQTFQPQDVADGVTVRIHVSDAGKPELKWEGLPSGKRTPPASMKSAPVVKQLQEIVKTLSDQQSRIKQTLEQAMIRASAFSVEELAGLSANPIFAPIVNRLIWIDQSNVPGFPSELAASSGTVRIAHPLDLLQSGRWTEFQKKICEEQIVQPFKQAFRELYVLDKDEKLDGVRSRRYEGYQFMAKKGAGVMKNRGWTIDYYDGLIKRYRKEGLVAMVNSDCCWFTPADIEPPVLETIEFCTESGRPVRLEDVPPRLFSETMRDVDLLVSVAHASGVGPEASHSTVEMRSQILAQLIPILRLNNVRIEKSHAFIHGAKGDYTVHLGSGVCHQSAAGMLDIVAVHSQTRGRMFLPFADDDPKTAEILSKILLLARK